MLQQFLSFVLLYKYTAVFGIIFGAAFGLPLPATAILLAGGAFAAEGYLSFAIACLVGFVGATLGDIVLFFLARNWGEPLLERVSFLKKILLSPQFKKVEARFVEHSFSLIFLSRFLVTTIGAPVTILAGFSKLSTKKFILIDALGELTYAVLYMTAGFIVGDEWQNLSTIFENTALIIVIGAVIIFLLTRLLPKKSIR